MKKEETSLNIPNVSTLDELFELLNQYIDFNKTTPSELEKSVAPLCILKPEYQSQNCSSGAAVTLADIHNVPAKQRVSKFDLSRLKPGMSFRKSEMLRLLGDIPTQYGVETSKTSMDAILRELNKQGIIIKRDIAHGKGYYTVLSTSCESPLPFSLYISKPSVAVQLVADYISQQLNRTGKASDNILFGFFNTAVVNSFDDVQKNLKKCLMYNNVALSRTADVFLSDLAEKNRDIFIRCGFEILVKNGALIASETKDGKVKFDTRLVIQMDGILHHDDALAQEINEAFKIDIERVDNSPFFSYRKNLYFLKEKLCKLESLKGLESIYLEKLARIPTRIDYPALEQQEKRKLAYGIHSDIITKLSVGLQNNKHQFFTEQEFLDYQSYIYAYNNFLNEEYTDLLT